MKKLVLIMLLIMIGIGNIESKEAPYGEYAGCFVGGYIGTILAEVAAFPFNHKAMVLDLSKNPYEKNVRHVVKKAGLLSVGMISWLAVVIACVKLGQQSAAKLDKRRCQIKQR